MGRTDVGESPFRQSEFLADLARLQAESMAAAGRLEHACENAEILQGLLASDDVASNVQRGCSVLEMHMNTMAKHAENRENMLSSRFDEYGVGFARSEDGTLYCCQYFRQSKIY